MGNKKVFFYIFIFFSLVSCNEYKVCNVECLLSPKQNHIIIEGKYWHNDILYSAYSVRDREDSLFLFNVNNQKSDLFFNISKLKNKYFLDHNLKDDNFVFQIFDFFIIDDYIYLFISTPLVNEKNIYILDSKGEIVNRMELKISKLAYNPKKRQFVTILRDHGKYKCSIYNINGIDIRIEETIIYDISEFISEVSFDSSGKYLYFKLDHHRPKLLILKQSINDKNDHDILELYTYKILEMTSFIIEDRYLILKKNFKKLVIYDINKKRRYRLFSISKNDYEISLLDIGNDKLLCGIDNRLYEITLLHR